MIREKTGFKDRNSDDIYIGDTIYGETYDGGCTEFIVMKDDSGFIYAHNPDEIMDVTSSIFYKYEIARQTEER